VLEDPLAIEKKSAEIEPGETREAPVVREKPVELPIGFKQGFVSEFGLGPFKDFGFIKPVEESDQLIFVHAMHIAPDSADLKKGDPVQYTVVDGLRWPEARNVSVIRNEPTTVTRGDDLPQQPEPAVEAPETEGRALVTSLQEPSTAGTAEVAFSGTKKETVTILKPMTRGKALVKTEQGGEAVCSAISSLEPLQAGQRFRAAVTYEKGKPVRAVFKGWK
jgi:cold shock CspA family protein